MKHITDYLHFYVGATCSANGKEFKLHGVLYDVNGTLAYDGTTQTNLGIPSGWWVENCDFKIHLRPLSDMTGGERIAAYDLHFHKNMNVDKIAPTTKANTLTLWMKDGFGHFTPETTRYLLSKSFDLFGLIESGLAIDKTAVPAP